jgi:MoaA/NifB/PqqE/SkfB family radical SAM enzyme
MQNAAMPKQLLPMYPKVIVFEVTNRCNLKCVMCSHGIGAVESPRDADLSLLEIVWPSMLQSDYLHLNGVGEPLMARPFWEIVDRLKGKKRPHIHFNTNGLLLTEENVSRLFRAPVRCVMVSLDAATPETYQDIRGGNFATALAGIERLVAHAKPKTGIDMTFVLMKRNIEEAAAYVELAARLGVKTVSFHHLTDTGIPADTWIVTRSNGWKFVYAEQRLCNYPELSNANVQQALDTGKRLGVNVVGDDLLFKEPKAETNGN